MKVYGRERYNGDEEYTEFTDGRYVIAVDTYGDDITMFYMMPVNFNFTEAHNFITESLTVEAPDVTTAGIMFMHNIVKRFGKELISGDNIIPDLTADWTELIPYFNPEA